MTPTIDIENLKQKNLREFAIRFGFGGAITAVTHLIAQAFGPSVAGLFLAFPAILPASLTLIRRHDGPREAAEDALGALPGSVALGLFAACVWYGFAHDYRPGAVVFTAAIVWLTSGVLFWWACIPTAHKAG